MTSTFFQRVRTCISLIERFGLKKVLIAARESHLRQESAAGNVLPASSFRKYQVFR